MRAAAKLARRHVLALLGGTALGLAVTPASVLGQVDQGIGGTGAAPLPIDKDQGIGGTGVIGTIRRFGSIVVNGQRIGYPRDVKVTLDGEPATAAALKLGQVVHVVARRERGTLTTGSIAVTSEVVGKVEKTSADGLTVLGQSVSSAGLSGGSSWKVGNHVGVSGLRRLDGVIVASLIERRPETVNRVAGPVVKAASGALSIGALHLSGLDPSFAGQRAVVEGKPGAERLEVTRARSDLELLGRGVTRISIEAFVERRGGDLRLGSGLVVAGGAARLRGGAAARAVITTQVDHAGKLQVQSLKVAAAEPPGRHLGHPYDNAGHHAPRHTDVKPPRPSAHDLHSNQIGRQRPTPTSTERPPFGGGHGSPGGGPHSNPGDNRPGGRGRGGGR